MIDLKNERVITLQTLANGAAIERFNDELQHVLGNLIDVNTDHKAKRVITLQVEFVPNEERSMTAIAIKCASKLPGAKTVTTMGYLGQQDGVIVATEFDPKQGKLFEVKNQEEKHV